MEKEKLGQTPAYPTDYVDSKNAGMSKRFYAACCAMHGICVNAGRNGYSFANAKDLIGRCYELADELLKQENE